MRTITCAFFNVSGFTSSILHNSRISCLVCSSSQGKELSQLTPRWSIPPLSNWSIWLLTQTCRCVFTWLCQCHSELERDKRPSSFHLGHFFSSKSFNHITKDASVFHLKSGESRRLSYFPTSTPSKHTSHHHNRSIASRRFLTCKYGQHSTGNRLWTHINFHSNFEPTWHLVTSPFSFILFLCTFPYPATCFLIKIYLSLIIIRLYVSGFPLGCCDHSSLMQRDPYKLQLPKLLTWTACSLVKFISSHWSSCAS
jgi:hypothetical protein